MLNKTLPAIDAYSAPSGLEWNIPESALDRHQSVRAAVSDERTITISGNIGDRYDGGVSEGYIRGALRRIGAGDITVNINSDGGDFFTGLAIYNMFREHEGAVTTNVVGIAASAASVIAMASDTLNVARAGFLMIHNASAIAIGNKTDMRAVADMLAQFDKAMANVYVARSGIDAKKIAAFMDAETFFDGETAVANGFADGLLASDDVEQETESPSARALREIDAALAKQGKTRTERRALLSDVTTGTPRATGDATPRAGLSEIAKSLNEFNFE